MTRKERFALGLVGTVALTGVALALRPDARPGPVSVADCRRVTLGMTEAEVESVLGFPADGRAPAGPVEWHELTHTGFGTAVEDPGRPPIREGVWRTERGSLRVQFTADGAACRVTYQEPLPLREVAARYLRRVWPGSGRRQTWV
jgi:hypothetical protein